MLWVLAAMMGIGSSGAVERDVIELRDVAWKPASSAVRS